MRKILTLLAVLLVMSGTAWAGSYEFVTLEFPPFAYTEGGKAKGLSIEVVEEAFKRMGHTANFKLMPWKRALKTAMDGQTDGVIQVLKTPEREQKLDFSDVIANEKVAFLVPASSNISWNGNLSSVSNYTIGVVRGFSYGDAFDKARKSGELKKFDESPTSDTSLKKLVGKRFDIFVGEPLVALYNLKKMGKASAVKVLEPPVDQYPAYVGFPKSRNLSALCAEFNKTLAGMRADGSYDKIMSKYK